MTKQSQETLNRLKIKAEDSDKRMPSVVAIHKLLDELNVRHSFDKTTHTVEYRSAGNTYVNDRHDGKVGYAIEVYQEDKELNGLSINTTESYYSWNSRLYAQRLIEILKQRKLII